jgi:ribosomal protein S18 acetylase RimI-like enzyme
MIKSAIVFLPATKKIEIESLYVLADYRHCGIARELTEKSLNWLIENGCQSIELDVAVGNEEVLPFYEKFGFYPRLYKLVRKT